MRYKTFLCEQEVKYSAMWKYKQTTSDRCLLLCFNKADAGRLHCTFKIILDKQHNHYMYKIKIYV